ncbi:hypothetical protein QFC20_002711 [Naganishia adeliensis]|uniref:Uncharacterized protein n=1 Tax=Naganishia adeliensis TaxID=92952 RepID=A0ACC2WHX6_9TREE|nr:hypothetical protein QFC20_002711 [Naganishia adeliensis]
MALPRIAIIGTGAAGLAQAKQVLDAFRNSEGLGVELVVFEARRDVGGVWLEDPEAGEYVVNTDAETNTTRVIPAKPGVLPSPIYPGLRTNLPKQLMAYRNTPFPEDVPLFPRAHHVEDYLRAYASSNNLLPYIRFETLVTHGAEVRGEFDFVSITNGHYEKASIPEISGLDKFTGKIMHSRWYRQPEDFLGKNVLVVGSFASGADIARELAFLNLPSSVLPESMTSHKSPRAADDPSRYEQSQNESTIDDERKVRVYQSSSQTPNMFTSGLAADEEDDSRPWLRLIEQRPLIDRVEEGGVIRFTDGSTLDDIDAIIFATGYLYYYPFFKRSDYPWNREEVQVLDRTVEGVDVLREDGKDVGGLQGLGMRNMDELMLFLEKDRSMALIGLPYQVVPFPLFEIQSHLVALLWAGRLPNFPTRPRIPSNPIHEPPTPPDTPRDPTARYKGAPASAESKTKRYTEQVRGAYVFGFPYEFLYENYLLSLTAEADGGMEGGWGEVEPFRWEYRKQKELRFKTIGY